MFPDIFLLQRLPSESWQEARTSEGDRKQKLVKKKKKKLTRAPSSSLQFILKIPHPLTFCDFGWEEQKVFFPEPDDKWLTDAETGFLSHPGHTKKQANNSVFKI